MIRVKSLILGATFLPVVLLAGLAQAQTADETKTRVEDAMSKLAFLTGNWAGPGTSYQGDGTATTYHDTEFVRFDLDAGLLLIDARGQRADGTVSYSLHTVIYYDAEANAGAGAYIYTPYSGERPPRSFQCTLEAGPKLLCYTPARTYRLTFQRLADGRWNEFGEALGEDGIWFKNFETVLTAVDGAP